MTSIPCWKSHIPFKKQPCTVVWPRKCKIPPSWMETHSSTECGNEHRFNTKSSMIFIPTHCISLFETPPPPTKRRCKDNIFPPNKKSTAWLHDLQFIRAQTKKSQNTINFYSVPYIQGILPRFLNSKKWKPWRYEWLGIFLRASLTANDVIKIFDGPPFLFRASKVYKP